MHFMVETLNKLIFWLTPDHMKDKVTEYKNIRMFLISHLFGPFLGHPITIYLLLKDPTPSPHVWVLGASITAFWFFPLALKVFQNSYFLLALASVQNLTFAILWAAYHYGGASSPFLMWFLVVPLLAFFYLGSGMRQRVVIFAQLFTNLAAFYGASKLYESIPSHIPLESMVDVAMISTLSAATYIFLMAGYYSSVVDSQSELLREIERHEATLTQLTDAKDDAERANNAKSDFLANMSHELRTPLNAVLGYSEILLEDAELDGRGEEIADLQKISAAGKHLLAMVNDILDISKIEAGKAELYLEAFNMDDFVKEVEATSRPLAAKNTNAFVLEKGEELGEVVMDATKVRQSVLNLLSNAAKFTENGTITLSVNRETSDGQDWILIAVRDTGVGISEENMNNLFRNFSQANASITAKFGGTGLGLSLSQNLCRLMGGSIILDSKLGEGSCFTIRLPATVKQIEEAVEEEMTTSLAPEAHVEPQGDGVIDGAIKDLRNLKKTLEKADESNADPKRRSVLVIDDDTNVLDVAERLLEREGYRAVTTDAPEAVMQLARTVKPYAIILDVLMPGLNGWDVIGTLKADADTSPIPVIMISNAENREKSRKNKATAFIEKPIDSEKLKEAMKVVELAGEGSSDAKIAG